MKQLIKDFNLPNYIKGKSFSEASKLIDKKFKDRKDSISLKTKDALLQRLADMQEHMKMQQKSQQAQQPNMSPEQMQMMQQGQQDQTGMQAYGGYSNNQTNDYFLGGDMKGGGNSPGAGAYLGAATGAIDMIGGLNGDGMSGDALSDVGGTAMKGVSAGMAFGPLGGAIGGVVGGLSGLIGSRAAKRKMLNKQASESHKASLDISNEYKSGGYTNDFKWGGPHDPVKGIDTSNLMNNNLINPLTNNPYNRPLATSIDTKGLHKPGLTQQDSSKLRLKQSSFNTEGLHREGDIKNVGKLSDKLQSTTPKGYKISKNGIGEGLSKGVDWMKNNYGSLLRGAPVITNALQLANMKKPAHENRQKLDQKYKKQYVDEMQLQNKVQNEYNNTSQALANASGGSTGSLRTNLLGAQLNKTKALSDAYMKADNINRAENEKGFRYGLETGKFNISQDNLEKDVNARNLGAYNTEKSKLTSALGENIGAIGKEKVSSKRIGEMLGYDVDGDYLVDKKSGEKITVGEAIKRNKKGGKNGFTEELKALNLFKNKDKKPSLSNRSFSPSFYNR